MTKFLLMFLSTALVLSGCGDSQEVKSVKKDPSPSSPEVNNSTPAPRDVVEPQEVTETSAAVRPTMWRSCENGIDHSTIDRAAFGPLEVLKPYSLGAKGGDKIVGGSQVDRIERYPWMAHLKVFSTDGKYQYMGRCGGTLISPQWVLTAAHCVDAQHAENDLNKLVAPGEAKKKIDILRVEVGLNNLAEASMVRYRSDNILCYSSYDIDSLEDDIALIKLNSPLQLNDDEDLEGVEIATLPAQGQDDLEQKNTNMATGWGRTETQRTSPTLMQIELSFKDGAIGEKAFITEVETGVGSICMGDSGGPTHVDYTDDNGTGTVVGITSFVRTFKENNCNFSGVEGIFTRVSHYRDDIAAALNNCTATDNCF